MSAKEQLNTLIEEFNTLTKRPETFLSCEDDLKNGLRTLLKSTYDLTKTQETSTLKNSNALPELIVQNFDLEQIWQQVELQNDSFIPNSLIKVSKLVTKKSKLLFDEVSEQDLLNQNNKDPSEENSDENPEDESSDDDDDDEPLNLQEDSDELALNSDDLSEGDDIASNDEEQDLERPRKKSKPSIVDDQFFKLDEMEAFLESEEKKLNNQEPDSGNDSEEDENMEEESEDDEENMFDNEFEDNSTERGGLNNPKYKDFFSEPERGPGKSSKSSKRNKFLEEVEEQEDLENEDENDEEHQKIEEETEENHQKPEQKSTFEQRHERLKQRMEELEEQAISEKPWQLKGEITAEARPQNSLLEQVVDFDLTSRPAPVITEETTMILEDVIRQRIKDRVFDSVKRKEKPSETPLEYKKKLVLDQEKSKQSLAQIYEKEFMDKVQSLDPDAADREEEEPQLHKDIKKMMHGLFAKLDSLSNFHYTPQPVQPELKIVSNLPAITIEEVAPVTASDAALLAPEEVKGKVRGDIIGKSERTETDKKRERRKKKDKQKKHANIQKKKELNLGMGNKYSKEKASKLLERVTKEKNIDKMDESTGSKQVKSSKAFFTELEDQVKSQIKNKTSKKKSSKDTKQLDAKKLKL